MRTLQKPMKRTWTSHELITLRSAKHRTPYVQSIFVFFRINLHSYILFILFLELINPSNIMQVNTSVQIVEFSRILNLQANRIAEYY